LLSAEPYWGARQPGLIDRTIIATTSRLPNNWLGLRAAIGLRRIVTTRLPGDSGLDVERWGLRMRLHPLHNGCEKGALFTPQMYETLERDELSLQIDKAAAAGRPFVFVDVGANVGLFSLFVASRAGGNAKILAIEPEPENVRRLQFNVSANPGVPIRVLPIAVDEMSGKVALEANRRDRGGTRTRPLSVHRQAGAVEVECLPLLELLELEGLSSIDALKIDVEGAEDRVLIPFFRNAAESLWPVVILIEDNHDSWPRDLSSVLAECGYLAVAKTKQNAILRRLSPSMSSSQHADGATKEVEEGPPRPYEAGARARGRCLRE